MTPDLDELGPADGRPLASDRLESIAGYVATRPELWVPHLDRSAATRTYVSLQRNASVDIWAILWRPGNDTGWHDHDTSSGAVHVVEGALVEHALRLGKPDLRRDHRSGACFSFGASRIHRLTCEVPSAVSIHVYSPPLWRLGQYTVDDDGLLHRVSVSYAEELRPLAPPLAA